MLRIKEFSVIMIIPFIASFAVAFISAIIDPQAMFDKYLFNSLVGFHLLIGLMTTAFTGVAHFYGYNLKVMFPMMLLAIYTFLIAAIVHFLF